MKKDKIIKENNIYSEYLNKISQATGFEKDKIEILESKKADLKSTTINQHIFKYNNTIYTLINDNLIE